MTEICVAHLVRKANDINSFQRFVQSYLAHPAALEHELIFIWKGFAGAEDLQSYTPLIADLQHTSFFVSDEGYDIGAYRKLACAVEYEYTCFLNSHVEILSDEWLNKLHCNLLQHNVGIAGATGSYESLYSGVLAAHQSWKGIENTYWYQRLNAQVELHWENHFVPFPNPHIRTNGFIIRRSTFLDALRFDVDSKAGCFRFESGMDSLTATILKSGLRALLVNSDGIGFDVDNWYESRAYRHEIEQKLLFGDNVTRMYEQNAEALKKIMRDTAWGEPIAAGCGLLLK